MDYEDWIAQQEERSLIEEDGYGEEEACGLCKAAPCRCDAIYDAWKEEGILIS